MPINLGPHQFWSLAAQTSISQAGFGILPPRIALPTGKQYQVASWRLTYLGGDDAWAEGDSYTFQLLRVTPDGADTVMDTFIIDSDPGGGTPGELVSTSLSDNLTELTDVGLDTSFQWTGNPGPLSAMFWSLIVREVITS